MILAWAMSRATTSGPVSDSRVFTGYLRQLGADLVHRPVQVDPHHVGLGRPRSRCSSVVSGRNRAGSVSSASRKTPSAVILPSACRSAEQETAIATGQRRAVAGQPHDADVVAEVLAAELGADAEAAGQLEHLLLELDVAEAVRRDRSRASAARRGTCADAYFAVFRANSARRAADDDGQVVGRAGRRAERAQLLVEEGQHAAAGSGPPWSPGRGSDLFAEPPPLAMNRNLYDVSCPGAVSA